MVLFSPLVRNRGLRLVVGLAVAVAIPVAALVLVQYRSISDLEHTSELVLDALSTQIADALVTDLRSYFEAPAFAIERMDHLAIDRRDLPILLAGLRARGAAVPLVDAFYLWSRRDAQPSTVLELANVVPQPDEPATFVDAGELSPRLIAFATGAAEAKLPWATSFQTVNDRRQAFVIHLLFDSSARERVTSFIGFRVDIDRFRTGPITERFDAKLATVNEKSGLATLVTDLVDQDGREVYRSRPQVPPRVLQERKVPLIFFAPGIMASQEPCVGCVPEWTLRVAYGEGTAASIASASTTSYRTLLGTLVVVLVLGLVLAARMALKEMQLAEAKSHFVASVSHDLRTPLAVIQLFAETLELGRVRSAARASEYYAIINREARKLGALIDNVLDFSRIESGLRMYRLQPLDLGETVRRVVSGFSPHLQPQGFEVRLDVAPSLPPVNADEEAVSLAVANLLSNAMKYAGTSRAIEVSVARSNGGIGVRVADQGIGIPWRHHRKIFRKFYRLEGDEPNPPRGCGLGLAIVDHVMRAHRGRVLVESESGRGSVFTLVFPALAEGGRDQADPGDRRRAPDAAGAA